MNPDSGVSDEKVVLLVEDNYDHANMVIRVLRRQVLSKRVLHLTDGEAALDYLFRRGAYQSSASSPRPDVVLLDLRLPRLDGLEVLRAAKECDALRDIPVVVMSSSAAASDMARAYRHHANSYLVKPSDYFQFVQLLEIVSTYWLAHNRTTARAG
jgi:CheY-like chemotaxis protein